MTLVEVVVGLAILGTLLASVLVARGKHLTQLHDARRKQAAVTAADSMLSNWFGEPNNSMPREGEGAVEGDQTLRWRSSKSLDSDIKVLNAEIIRLEIFDARQKHSNMSLVSVEVSLPKPPTVIPVAGNH